ncbi:copper radical oxidase [Desarmillaria tabescens]|uniref:Copper radical oxidase n=1 Tax=Armillaria tabescens TaxID=1929756 RepID=A0AA39TZG4_ARMTA|nr:copper radical oxidase [Desarmillaria tabescens]KAK0463830.1 copper radical oxidase [Desarmillaria tabescens]
MAISRRLLYAIYFLSLAFFTSTLAAESAWNGHTTPGSTTPAAFSSFYIPPGSKSYDSSSPMILYRGHWTESFHGDHHRGSIRTTNDKRAEITFSFTGTGVEWFGTVGRHHGTHDVYLDGVLVQQLDSWSPVSRKGQRIFSIFDLAPGKHILKVKNIAKGLNHGSRSVMDINAFVVTQKSFSSSSATPSVQHNLLTPSPFLTLMEDAPSITSWKLTQKGLTGVHAMQLAVISNTHAIVIDKVEHNPLVVDGHPAWGALLNLDNHSIKPLRLKSNSFCAGGTFLRNGELINVGGNPVVEDRTSAADFGDVNGLQAIRRFKPCDHESIDNCDILEDHSRLRMASSRWYNTVIRISDGSAMIIGGSKKGGWINNATVNNPTFEFWPPKSIHGSRGMPIHSQFLVDTLNSNLFPIAFSLPDGRVFIAANRDAMIYDWKTNREQRLPQIPNGVRVTYPMAGTGLLLPLSSQNDYTPEILLCGGSTIDDHKAAYGISSQDPASSQCSRMVLTDEGISAGWQVELMPEARLMPDAVLLPTGQIVIVNGAGSGIAGYGNTLDQVGASNADHPILSPILYDPLAKPGERFSSVGVTSDIARLYHSVATLTPSGSVLIAGSNPNLDRSDVKYGTEYRTEWLNPPYMNGPRPSIDQMPGQIHYGQKIRLRVTFPITGTIQVVLMDLGYVTHSVHANSRLVYLEAAMEGEYLVVTGPPREEIYPPGPGWIYVLDDGVPSKGRKIIVGDGKDPHFDKDALEYVLRHTKSV